MHTCHSTFSLSGRILHRVDFDAATFSDDDLRWLPDPPNFSRAVVKRKAEHLAGRLAAFYALHAHGIEHIAGTGDRRQPLWPDGWYGSISHCGNSALATVAKTPVGVDIEKIIDAGHCEEIAPGIIGALEREVLDACGLDFPLGLTLAFSAKESLYKALSFRLNHIPEFSAAEVIHCGSDSLTLRLNAGFHPALAGETCRLPWQQIDERVVTLALA